MGLSPAHHREQHGPRRGDVVVDLGLYFEMVENGFVHPQPIFLNAEFYAAEIEVDAILSYPW